MEAYLSEKLKKTSFILMILVVFLHSYNLKLKQGLDGLVFEKGFAFIIEDLFSYGITRIAVPLFFIISGYLFFMKRPSYTDIFHQMTKRFRTLILPYFICAFIGVLIYFVLQSLPQSQKFFSAKLIVDFNFSDWINVIFVDPIPYQLWFLRDLIILIIFSPVIFFILKNIEIWFVLSALVLWLLNFNTPFLTGEAFFFFLSGAYIGLFYPSLLNKKIQKGKLVVFLWLLFLIMKSVFNCLKFSEELEFLIMKISILFGLVAFWHLYDVVNTKLEWLAPFVPFSFFIYLIHEPILTIVKKGLFGILAHTEMNYLFVYFLAPLVTIAFCLLSGAALKKYVNPFYNVMTGNR